MCINLVLADDHEPIRECLRLLLEQVPNFHVLGEAVNGREALAMVIEFSPDIAVLDLLMPELNGLEVAEQIQQLGLQTQVILLSLYVPKFLVQQALALGVRGYIAKEAAGSEIIAAIYTVYAGNQYIYPPDFAFIPAG